METIEDHFAYELGVVENHEKRHTRTFILMLIGMVLSGILLWLTRTLEEESRELFFVLFWFLGEFVVIAVVYLLFTQHWFESDIPITFRLVARASLCVGMILSIPYLIFGLLASNRAKTEEIDALKLSLKDQAAAQGTNLVHFYDFNGVLRISIEVEKIYYIASQDNYVEIRYEMGGKLLNYLLRCRTTRLEKQLESTPLVRCHRSYIVNVDNVTQFKREKANAFLVLSHPEAKRIPVSKSYYKTIAEHLGRIAS